MEMKPYEINTPFYKFLTSFLIERNVEKTISFLDKNVQCIGIEQEINDRETFRQFLKKEVIKCPNLIPFYIQNYKENRLNNQITCCFGEIMIEKKESLQKVQMTIIFQKEQRSSKIVHIHYAVPTTEDGEYFIERKKEQEKEEHGCTYERKFLEQLLEMIPVGGLVTYRDQDFSLYYMNQELIKELGYTQEELIRDPKMIHYIHNDDVKRVQQTMFSSDRNEESYVLDYRLKKKDGSYVWIYEKGKQIQTEDGVQLFFSVILDVSKTVELKLKFEAEASVDSLTGIYNRRKAMELIKEQEIEKVPAALLMIDIDNFKKVNDTYGHQHGDEVLRGLANILKKHTRKGDIVSRFGGDEFLVYLSDVTSQRVIYKRVEQLKQIFSETYAKRYPDCELGISIGMIYMEDNQIPFHVLYTEVDKALYHVKNNGKSGVHFIQYS